MSPSESSELLQAALRARDRSYSPYSGQKVGSAIRLADGRVFGGCNVENSSYGGTVCAERVAVQKAVSETGPGLVIAEVLVVTDHTPPWPPCGLCRQVIAEFATPATRIHLAHLQGVAQTLTFGELFPLAFTPGHLGKTPDKSQGSA